MIRRLKKIVLLVLAILTVVMIHERVKREMAETTEEQSDSETVIAPEAGQVMSVIRLGTDITLGRVEPNEDKGGVNVILKQEDGTEQVYTFTDVAADSWYVNAVNFVVSAQLMKGMGAEPIFHPEYGVLREELTSILYRFTRGEKVEPRFHFDDVKEEDYFYYPVAWVTNKRLMTGLSATKFGVGEFLTCEDALVALYRLADEPETDGTLQDYPYAAKVSESARRAVDWAWKSGLITETECIWYPPQAISRAQMALLLLRFSTMVG